MTQPERVVYILGAGFSAPLGLPVISNFFGKARSLLEAQPDTYGHFRAVLDLVTRYAQVLHLYAADFFSIEEVLSLAEMESRLSDDGDLQKITNFVRDVISASTPTFDAIETGVQCPPPGAYIETSTRKLHFAEFAFNLLSLRVHQPNPRAPDDTSPTFDVYPEVPAVYGVVTFNYDTVLERCAATLPEEARRRLGFQNPADDYSLWEPGRPVLAKLHGCVSGGDIIAPTWSKSLPPGIARQWRAAKELLGQATQIRVLGYSLPEADAYARYLLKAAAVSPPILRSFDVICRDSTGEVQRRYESFVRFSRRRFLNASIETYWRPGTAPLSRESRGPMHAWSRTYDCLEWRHDSIL